MLQHITMTAATGRAFQRAHQLSEVGGSKLRQRGRSTLRHGATEQLVLLPVARHQLVLVTLMKADQGVASQSAALQLLPVSVGEYPGNEVFLQYRILEPPFLFHR